MPAPSKGLLEVATRQAIDDIIRSHAQTSKFGLHLSPEGLASVTDQLYSLFVTSRNLKTAGDRFLGGSPASSPPFQKGKSLRP